MDDRYSDIESEPDDFHFLDNLERSIDTSRSPNIEQLGGFEVNPPRRSSYSLSEDDDNFENFHVEFGTAATREGSLAESGRITSVLDDLSEISDQEEDQAVELEIKDPSEISERTDELELVPENLETEEQLSDTKDVQEPQEIEADDFEKDEGEPEEVRETDEPAVQDTSFTQNLVEEKREGMEDEPEEPDKPAEEEVVEEAVDLELNVENVDRMVSERGSEVVEVPIIESNEPVSNVETSHPTGIESEAVSSRSILESRDAERLGPRMIRGTEDEKPDKPVAIVSSGKDKEKRKRLMKPDARPVKRKYLTPAAVISQYVKGNLTNSEAMDAIMKFRVNKMLPKKVDGVYMDKDEFRIPKGYSFAKAAKSGSKKYRIGLTRIEREIRAYQESTQMLIPRAIFARIVKEIAQGWFKGEGQIKFTVEALAALQVATEDEIIRLLEISTACSYHAKRITLRVDDMRLARFCRGRQNYEFTNIN